MRLDLPTAEKLQFWEQILFLNNKFVNISSQDKQISLKLIPEENYPYLCCHHFISPLFVSLSVARAVTWMLTGVNKLSFGHIRDYACKTSNILLYNFHL